ncbi:MAG: hypothetical protein FJW90_12305 [Actinobacteria bacterium]|nr:hypothetical protein [Actinomycetota bacterium]MBM4185523.1 hypothetical protein [Gemmatimonadota bacterium]
MLPRRIAIVGGGDWGFNLGMVEVLRRIGLSPVTTAAEELASGRVLLGSGASFLVLEAKSHARRRRHIPVAEVLGYGESTESGGSRTEAYERAIGAALRMARSDPEELSFVHLDSAAGGGIAPEEPAIAALAPEHAGSLHATTSRAAVGYIPCAAAAFDVGVSALALRARLLPPMPPRWARSLRTLRGVVEGARGGVYRKALATCAGFDGATSAIVLGSSLG